MESSQVTKTEIEERFNALVRSLDNIKGKTTELDHAKKIASLPCVHCETLFLSCDRPQCTHSRRPNLRTLIETKKETELRERREKVEKGRARKVRKTQSAMECVSVVNGCKDDEYDIESVLLAIEGPSQGSKQKRKKISKTKSSQKEMRNMNDRSSNRGDMSAASVCPPIISSLLHEEEGPATCSSRADEDIQMHLKELLFGGKLLKQMKLVKKIDHEEGLLDPVDTCQVGYDPAVYFYFLLRRKFLSRNFSIFYIIDAKKREQF